jgi:hypothetical protein
MNKFYTQDTCCDFYTTYGGELETADFNTYEPNKNRINNQVKAIDESKKEANANNQMIFTLEELKELKLISNTEGRPLPYLTDEKWQHEFNLRKGYIKPYPMSIRKLGGRYSRESGRWNTETNGQYHGCTNWHQYCLFINDVLNNIRTGQIDYCYYIYQIMDLLKFHHDDLRTRYCDGYWEVWLER